MKEVFIDKFTFEKTLLQSLEIVFQFLGIGSTK